MNQNQLIKPLSEIASSAGEAILDIYNSNFQVTTKNDQSKTLQDIDREKLDAKLANKKKDKLN